jgi:S-adenosyl methyltransferase
VTDTTPDSGDFRSPATPQINTEVAHNARVWNYWLGGKDNYPVDREVGDQIFRMFPSIVDVARADRHFLGRAVRYLAGEAGVRQFLDIGTGLPTVDNTHEVAQRVASDARVVYVDNDPLVLAYAQALLTGNPDGVTAYIDADVHEPGAILAGAAEILDFSRPVAVMMLGILNFVQDSDQAREIVTSLVDALPAGGHLVVTHPTLELGGEVNVEAMAFWNEHAAPPIRARTGEEVARFFDGLELLEPGLVSCTQWRPEAAQITGEPPRLPQYGAVGRKA